MARIKKGGPKHKGGVHAHIKGMKKAGRKSGRKASRRSKKR